MARSPAVLAASLFVLACAPTAVPPPLHDAGPRGDSGPRPDGGGRLADSGPPRDAAGDATDVGPSVDAGGPTTDSGTLPSDDCTTAPTSFYVVGDAADPLTGGFVHVGSTTALPWSGTAFFDSASISAQDSHADPWNFRFESDDATTPLTVGTYLDAERVMTGSAGHPGLLVSADASNCTVVVGSFTIHEIEVSFGEVQRFRATFEQHCEGGTSRAIGCVSFTAP